MAQRGAEDSDAEGTPPASSFLETRGGGSIDRWASRHVQSGTSLPELMELGAALCAAGPGETLLRSRTHRAAAIEIRRRTATGRKRSKKCYVGATVGPLMLGKLIAMRARTDSNRRPPGSKSQR